MSQKIKCLIVEDEPPAMQLMETYIQKLPVLELAGKCYDALEAMDWLKKQTADVIFLDINMPSLTGLEMAGLIPKSQKIIFTTAYSEHALDSFAFHVVDYLLKPVSFKRFLESVQKLQAYQTGTAPAPGKPTDPTDDMIFIKTGRQLLPIQTDSILYIEAHKEYLCIHTLQQKHLVYKRMKDMASTLPDQFMRIHNSYIINLRKMGKADQHSVEINGMILPISNSYRESFQEKMKKHLL
jgi:DNA-binding LytR/AlgR family response regulator